MAARVVAAVEERLVVVLATAEAAVDQQPLVTLSGRLLNRLTIGWNAVEGILAVAAGLAAGSVSLVGFGLDSGIEVSAALILAWRLAQERGQGCTQAADRRATRAIAVSFLALAAYVGVESIRDLLGRSQPGASLPGIVLAPCRWWSCRCWPGPSARSPRCWGAAVEGVRTWRAESLADTCCD
jgi:hypothetical protein